MLAAAKSRCNLFYRYPAVTLLRQIHESVPVGRRNNRMELGLPMREQFSLDQSVAFLNHCGYGVSPKCVMEHRFKLLEEQETLPDRWFRFNLSKVYEDALAAAADFIGASTENLALIDNTTTGVCTIMKSLSFQHGDKILTSNHTYEAVQLIVKEQHDFKGVETVMVDLTLPIKSEDDLVNRYEEAFSKHDDIKLAVFDHISSASALLFPVARLIEVARKYGAMVLIDGAHAPGQLDLNVEKLGADFYVGNFHKWCFVPRSSAFLWFSPKFNGQIRCLVTSFGYGRSINAQFSSPGTRDFSIIPTLPRAIEFYRSVGGVNAIQKHAKELLDFALEIFGEINMKMMDVPESMRAPLMLALSMPISGKATKRRATEMLREILLHSSVQINVDEIDEVYYARMSCSIYNTKQDYIKARDGIKKYLEDCCGVIF